MEVKTLPLHLNIFHKFTNHSYKDIEDWLNNNTINHYVYVWPTHLNTNCVSIEMKLIKIDPSMFVSSDEGYLSLKEDVDSIKEKDFFDTCKIVLNHPVYLDEINDIQRLFIRPIFHSDLREIKYEVDNWYLDKTCKYNKFNNILDNL